MTSQRQNATTAISKDISATNVQSPSVQGPVKVMIEPPKKKRAGPMRAQNAVEDKSDSGPEEEEEDD